jgi:hypothetical protein
MSVLKGRHFIASANKVQCCTIGCGQSVAKRLVGQVRARRPQFDARFARRSGIERARPSASVASASSMSMRGKIR